MHRGQPNAAGMCSTNDALEVGRNCVAWGASCDEMQTSGGARCEPTEMCRREGEVERHREWDWECVPVCVRVYFVCLTRERENRVRERDARMSRLATAPKVLCSSKSAPCSRKDRRTAAAAFLCRIVRGSESGQVLLACFGCVAHARRARDLDQKSTTYTKSTL